MLNLLNFKRRDEGEYTAYKRVIRCIFAAQNVGILSDVLAPRSGRSRHASHSKRVLMLV